MRSGIKKEPFGLNQAFSLRESMQFPLYWGILVSEFSLKQKREAVILFMKWATWNRNCAAVSRAPVCAFFSYQSDTPCYHNNTSECQSGAYVLRERGESSEGLRVDRTVTPSTQLNNVQDNDKDKDFDRDNSKTEAPKTPTGDNRWCLTGYLVSVVISVYVIWHRGIVWR